MRGKYFRFFIIEAQFRTRLILIVIFLVACFLLQGHLKILKIKAQQVTKEKELVQKINEMEKIASRLNKPSIVKNDPSEFKLGGTTNQNGTYYAIINGDVLKQGDYIHDFVVAKIAMGEAVLENKTTLERRNLYLWQETITK